MNVIQSIGAKAITMVISLVCGVVTTRLILTDAGVHEYALYTLLLGLPGLISFTDLGAGATIVNQLAVSKDPHKDSRLVAQLTTVGRIMLGFAAVAMALNTIMFLTGVWPLVLGSTADLPHADTAAFVSLTIFCVGIPLTIWQRIFIGLGKNHLIILVQGILSPLTLLIVWLLTMTDDEALHPFLALASLTATLVVAVLGYSLAARYTSPALRLSARHVLFPRSFRGTTVMHTGWPMLAQTITTPIATQSQRFIIAQFVAAGAVAQYGVAGQIFFALQSLVSAAGLALWPMFTAARAHGAIRRGPFQIGILFFSGCALFTIVIAAASPMIYGFISGGTMTVPISVTLSFGFMVAVQAALYPLGMFMMDATGLRFQVLPALLMATFSVTLALVATPIIGVAGALLANAVSVIGCQIIPFAVRIHRHWDELTIVSSLNGKPEPVAK